MSLPVFQIGAWRVSPDLDLLESEGRAIRLQPRVTRLLVYLAERAGHVVSREELLREVWDGRFVTDAVLTTAIWELREALEDDAKKPQWIETVPRRGYRLVAPPAAVPSPPAGAAKGRPARGGLTLWIAAALAAAAMLTAWLAVARRDTPAAGSSVAIAVLPIRNDSGDPAQDYLADGMTDSLITELARRPGLGVTSRTSVTAFKERLPSMPRIAAELRVSVVVEGAIVRSGDRLRLSAQLIDARRDLHLWSESYERPLGDILELQGELARAVAHEVELRLSGGGQRRPSEPSAPPPPGARGNPRTPADRGDQP